MANTRRRNEALRVLLVEAGWSGARLAAAVRAVGAETPTPVACDRSSVARWIAGTHPRQPAQGYVQEALSRRLGRPVTAREAGFARTVDAYAQPPSIPTCPWENDIAHALVTLARADTIEPRAYSCAALQVPGWPDLDAARARARLRPEPQSGCLGRAESEGVTAMVSLFHGMAERHGGRVTRSALNAFLATEISGRLWSHAPHELRRRLLTDAGRLTVLLARAHVDAGADFLAQHSQRVAVALAAHAQDTDLYALAVCDMSARATELGHHQAALGLATQGSDAIGAHGSDVMLSHALAQEAIARAHLGQHDTSMACLGRAEAKSRHAGTRPPQPIGPSPAFLALQRARTLHALGRHPDALGAANAALRRFSRHAHLDRAVTHALCAEIELRLGLVEAAAASWEALVREAGHVHSVRIDQRLSTIRGQLRSYRRKPVARPLPHPAR